VSVEEDGDSAVFCGIFQRGNISLGGRGERRGRMWPSPTAAVRYLRLQTGASATAIFTAVPPHASGATASFVHKEEVRPELKASNSALSGDYRVLALLAKTRAGLCAGWLRP
jgi:hypothetical protein